MQIRSRPFYETVMVNNLTKKKNKQRQKQIATSSHLTSLNMKRTTTYDVGNTDTGLRQAQHCIF